MLKQWKQWKDCFRISIIGCKRREYIEIYVRQERKRNEHTDFWYEEM
jgi:hypothetical protein